MFQNILLESEQKELLTRLVEISRKMPRDQRAKFIVAQGANHHVLINPGHPSDTLKIFIGDLEILAHADLVNSTTLPGRGSPNNVYVLPLGYAYYEHMKREAGQPLEHVEISVRNYLSVERFRQKYPVAYQKWAEAEDMLWSSDSERQLTMIGHLCREAVQEFATHLVEQYKLTDVQDKTKTVDRIRAVLNHCKGNLGDKEGACLAALVTYWKTVIDLIQREEHGGQKEGSQLVWEDGRRVVFQTAVVMFEIDCSITK